jgi:D-glycero-D-manno-heptose 1,7-bisphosphate phosphatase
MKLKPGINSVLFLDRDGVINRRITDDYVKTPDEFIFMDRVTDALKILSAVFSRIVVVTNQQGIGRGLMTDDQLNDVHQFMIDQVSTAGGKIDHIFYCPHLASDGCNCRKPATGMFYAAKKLIPQLDTTSSVMAGDSLSDLQFGRNAGLSTVLISKDVKTDIQTLKFADEQFGSLFDFAKQFSQYNVLNSNSDL